MSSEEASSASTINTITWTEIPATDVSRISAFYSTVFGWTSKPFPTPAPDSTCEPTFMLFSHGNMHGGFSKVAPENHLSPAKHTDNAGKEKKTLNVAISVDSLEEKLKAIEENGGALYRPKHELPEGMGFVAYFTDSEENVMALWAQK